MAYKPWTDEQIELLKKHHSEGCSYSQIANLIFAATGTSFTKNACIGKGGRLGLTPRRVINKGGRSKLTTTRTVAQRIRPKGVAPVPYVEVIPPHEPEHLGLSILQLDHRCKYARGDENFTFCGQPSLEGHSYCDFHQKLCWRPPEARTVRRYGAAA